MEKKGLGKGLGALIPGADRDERGPSDIAIERIAFNRYQPRKKIDDEKFQDLVRSVRLHGILQPIVVRSTSSGAYELVAGERRLRAATQAGLTRVPAVVKEFTDEQSLEVALIENLQREDIGPLDSATAYKRLIDEFGLTQDEIAFRIGKSRPSVANTLRLLNLPVDIQDSLSAGEITEGHARALLGLSDADGQREVWRTVVKGNLNVRETEKLCRERGAASVSRETIPAAQSSPRSTSEAPVERDPNLVDVEDQLRRLFGTRVTIAEGRDRGRIVIEYYNEDDLTRILSLLGTV